MVWNDKAIIKLTDTNGWTNKAFDMIFGYSGKGYDTPNEKLKAIEGQAADEGKPFGIWYKFSMAYYTGQQYPYDESKWPGMEMDYPLQMLVRAVQNRDCKAVVIEVTDAKDHAGHDNPSWCNFASRIFIKKFQTWLKANKPGCKLYIATSHDWCAKNAPAILNWIHEYQTVVVQEAKLPLVAAFPHADEKPGWIGNSTGWKFWLYRRPSSDDSLLLFSGTPAFLRSEMGMGMVVPPPRPDPVDPDEGDPGKNKVPVIDLGGVEEALGRIVDLCEQMTVDLSAIRSVFK